jgi:hypothetical protein
MREIRLTIRSLARTPLYTLTAVVSLALGIGATTAIFSMMDQVVMRTLPVKAPERLAFVYHPGPLQGSSSTSEQGGSAFSYPMFREMQAQQTAFDGLAGSYAVSASAAYNNAAANTRALLVSGNYFQVLGVGAATGRVFDENDDRQPGGHPLVVLTHAYWTSRFGADPGMLNQTMVVNGRAMTIVGVAGTFAGLATLLASIGLYGVLAFNVARRTREIGIRMALGAGVAQVRGLVVREVLLIVGLGGAIGLSAAWFAGALVQSVLFGTQPADPWIFGGAAAALGLIALLAAYVPARRATGVDPMIALRYE